MTTTTHTSSPHSLSASPSPSPSPSSSLLWHHPLLAPVRVALNRYFQSTEPADICKTSAAAVILLLVTCTSIKYIHTHGLRKTLFSLTLRLLKLLPFTAQKVKQEQQKTLAALEEMVKVEEVEQQTKYTTLPDQPMSALDLLSTLSSWSSREQQRWQRGQASGTVYHGGSSLLNLQNRVFALFSLSNPLHPDVFPYVRKMEAEVVSMTLSLFSGLSVGVNGCGCMTSGGTESILMAMKTYRDRAQHLYGIEEAEIICSSTSHAAFSKAAHYFRMKLVVIPVDSKTFQLPPEQVRRAITRNTVVIIANAPAFPHGIMDDVAALSAVASEYQLPVHVDCCLGSFLLPFLPSIGYPIPLFDFRLPAVMSISCDTHKYGYAVKGSSVIMYRDSSIRAYQYFVAADWSGGIYASPTMAGSRPGGLIACTWAVMLSLGVEGYRAAAREIMNAANAIKAAIADIHGLKVLGSPLMSVIAFTSTAHNIYAIGECMTAKHWSLNTLQHPPALHLSVTYLHKDRYQQFITDLTDSVRAVQADPDKYSKGSAAIYGMAATIPDTSVVDELARSYMDALFKV